MSAFFEFSAVSSFSPARPHIYRPGSSKLRLIRARRLLRRGLALCFHPARRRYSLRKFDPDYSSLNQILFRRPAQRSRRPRPVRRCFDKARLSRRILLDRQYRRFFRKIWRLLRRLAPRLCRFCIKIQALRSRAPRLFRTLLVKFLPPFVHRPCRRRFELRPSNLRELNLAQKVAIRPVLSLRSFIKFCPFRFS